MKPKWLTSVLKEFEKLVALLTCLTIDSNIPPMRGDDGGLKYQVIPSWASSAVIYS